LISNDLAEGVDRECAVDLTVAADGADRAADAGGVHAGPQRRDRRRLLDGGGDLLGPRDVDLGEDALDLLGERLALVGLEVGDDDGRAARGEGTGAARSDAAGAAGHDRGAVGQIHGRDSSDAAGGEDAI
jgi:hypothetical protein